MEAAVEVVAQVGPERATHRAIAAAAGVPLGSTTYYFPTLHDLLVEAVAQVAREWEDLLADWASAVTAADDLAAGLAGCAADYAEDRQRARRDYELYVLAARDPAMRAVARAWVDGLRALLAPLAGDAAGSLGELVDGALLQAVVTDAPVDRERLAGGLRRLLREPG